MVKQKPNGYLEVISGCMFSGKTEELLRRLRRAEIADEDIAVFKPKIDDRYGEETIGSHNGREWVATVIEVDENGQEFLLQRGLQVDVLAVDEFNFFDEEFVPVLQQIAENGTRVIVSGTDQTFRAEPFEPMHEIMAIADEVEKLNAICEKCGSVASRNQRLIDGKPAPEDAPTVQVGGSESYEARCLHCHEVADASE